MPQVLHIDASPRQERFPSEALRGSHSRRLTSDLAKNEELPNRESLVSWLFLIGSLMFLFDGFIELTEGISIHVLIHLIASILFTIGSVLFLPTNQK